MVPVLVAVCALSLLVLILGLRGRRVDDHPVCGRCGFDLVGAYPGTGVCPECGALLGEGRRGLLRRRIMRIGNRRRRRGVLAASAATLLIAGGLAGLLAWSAWSKGGWNSHKPTWWLMLETRSRSPSSVDAALSELMTRRGTGRLSQDQQTTLINRGLAWQADPALTWLKGWGDLIEAAWNEERLTPAQRDSYARHAIALRLVARTRVRQGDQLPALVEVEQRIGAAGLLQFELGIKELKLADQQVLSSEFSAAGDLQLATGAPATFDLSISPEQEYDLPEGLGFSLADLRRDPGVDAPPGRYTVTATCHLGIRAGNGGRMGATRSWGRGPMGSMLPGRRDGASLAEWDEALSAPVQIVAPSVETVELIESEGMARSVNAGAHVSIADEKALPFRPTGRRASISLVSVPVDMAFDVVVSGPNVKKTTRLAVTAGQGNISTQVDIPSGDSGARYDVVLTPSRDQARRSVRMTKIWGREIAFKDLPVGSSPKLLFAPPAPTGGGFETLATLRLPREDRSPGNHAFRSVALHPPYVYVGDRLGDLYIFRVEESDRDEVKSAEKVVKNVGDGQDLKVVGDTLLCTRNGSLEAYALKDPGSPEHLDTFGPPMRFRSASLVAADQRAFVLGDGHIVSFDTSNPAAPRLIGMAEVKGHLGDGCIAGHYLCASEWSTDWGSTGIAVYNIADPVQPKRVSFVPTQTGAFGMFTLRDGRVLACLDDKSRMLVGSGPHGNVLLINLDDPLNPKTIAEVTSAGGRTSALVRTLSDEYLVCNGAVSKIEADGLGASLPLIAGGSNLDGASYHGDARGNLAAIVLDDQVVVVKFSGP